MLVLLSEFGLCNNGIPFRSRIHFSCIIIQVLFPASVPFRNEGSKNAAQVNLCRIHFMISLISCIVASQINLITLHDKVPKPVIRDANELFHEYRFLYFVGVIILPLYPLVNNKYA